MIFKAAVIFLLQLLVLYQGCDCQPTYHVVTSPEKVPGQDKIIVPAQVGQENISIYCYIYSTFNNVENDVAYEWTLINGITKAHYPLSYNEFPFLIANNDSTVRNITIRVFSSDMDRMSLVCNATSGAASETFLFGIPYAPTLASGILVNVTEGGNFTVDLAGSDNDPFPPYINSYLSFNGQTIQYTNIFIANDYTIKGNTILRNQSGIYILLALNDAGSTNTSFTINVQYQPEGDLIDTVVYTVIGERVNLTSYANLNGNPMPFTSWFDVNGTSITTDVDYISPAPTILTIVNVKRGMLGNYTFMASNVIGTLVSQIQLILAVPPGSPTNTKATNITSESAVIKWTASSAMGVPMVTHYVIYTNPSVNGVPFTTASTDIILFDLFPVTSYNITIFAVSSFFSIDTTTGITWFVFTTEDGPPKIDEANFSFMNGMIKIDWDLRHTGGLIDTSVIVYCSEDMNFVLIDGSGSGFIDDTSSSYFILPCEQCISPSLDGSATSGIVTAGTKYFCTLSVSNALGTDSRQETVISTTGKPSKPIIDATSTDGQIIVDLLTEYPGNDVVTFIVSVTTDANVTIFNESFLVQNDMISNTNDTIYIKLSSSGRYYIIVVAENRYGVSKKTQYGPINFIPAPIPIEVMYFLIIIIGASVGGILLIVIIISIIICICACCYRKRRTRTLEFHTTRSQTWKRGIEMSQRKRYLN